MSGVRLGLSVTQVTESVGEAVILDGSTFDVPAGALAALVGPNGAGKSTLLRIVAGIQRPDAGEVLLDGVDLLALPRRERARRVALVEQDATTELPVTARAVAGLGRTPHDALLGGRDPSSSNVVDAALEDAGAAPFADREVPTLSGGERQRVLLARALAQQPRLMLLDEPMNHLDIAAQLDVLRVLGRLAASGVTVFAAMHDLALAAAHASHVVVLSRGAVVASGSTAEVLTPELIREVYGVGAAWTTNPVTGAPLLALG